MRKGRTTRGPRAETEGAKQVASPTTSTCPHVHHIPSNRQPSVEALVHTDKHVQVYRRRSWSSRAGEAEEPQEETTETVEAAGVRVATAATAASDWHKQPARTRRTRRRSCCSSSLSRTRSSCCRTARPPQAPRSHTAGARTRTSTQGTRSRQPASSRCRSSSLRETEENFPRLPASSHRIYTCELSTAFAPWRLRTR